MAQPTSNMLSHFSPPPRPEAEPDAMALQAVQQEEQALEAAIMALLVKRSANTSICPSEAARAIYPTEAAWRSAMPAVRRVAAGLVARGLIEVTQGGKLVDINTAKGAIRLRLGPKND